jgi:CSLREA domain-containing protein
MKNIRTIALTCAAAAFLATTAPQAAAATFVVTSTADGSDNNPGNGTCSSPGNGCTLRAAIQEANAFAGTDVIQFAIGSGVQTINVGSALPTISTPMTIDGATQPGYAGAPLIVLHGGSGAGLTLTSTGSTVRGLVINNFSGNGININGGGNNVIVGNYIGTDQAGTTGVGNSGAGVEISGSTGNRIGGRTVAERNLISGNTGKGNLGGVKIDGGATGNIIQGNFIGSDITGTLPIGNEGRGVAIHNGSGNFIGGAQPGAGNLIIGNRATGVRIVQGSGNLILGNYIGLAANGTYEYGVTSNARGIQFRSDGNTAGGNYIVGNLYDGVLFYEGSASNNLVQANLIVGNGMHGIDVTTGTGNRLLSNQIFANGYLAISLTNGAFDQVTPNDGGDGDTGTNGLQNFPVLTSATTGGTVSGTLNSKSNQTYLVQFFAGPACNPSGYGDSNYFLGQTNVTTNVGGNGAFTTPLGAALPAGWVVTSTATDAGGNTSEMSACTTVK